MLPISIRPDADSPLTKLRRVLPNLILLTLAFGTLASVDALYAEISQPKNTFCVDAGEVIELSAPLPTVQAGLPPRVKLTISPATAPITASKITTTPAGLLSDASWDVTLTVGTVSIKNDVRVEATYPDLTHEPAVSWQLTTYPDHDSLRADSPSVFISTFDIEPIDAAFVSLAVALLLVCLYPFFYLLDRKSLAKNGLLRVFHVRNDGADTLLYCVQPQKGLSLTPRSYRVFSATGQLLGLAELDERGRKHCVFRLHTNRARAGCLVVVR